MKTEQRVGRHGRRGLERLVVIVMVATGVLLTQACANNEAPQATGNLEDSSPVVEGTAPEATDGVAESDATEATESTESGSPEPVASTEPADASTYGPGSNGPRINQIQVIGSHNSYHLRPREEIFGALVALAPELATGIEYSHVPLSEQLATFGIRQFELDVFADPDGGRWANHAAHSLVGLEPASGEPILDEPGFKVLHTQDFDYATNCLTLVLCLREIREFSDANPNHLPVMVMIEIKDESIQAAAEANGLDISIFDVEWSEPAETTGEVLDALDAEIRSVFDDDHLITPDDVRGDAETLEAAVLDSGWPTVADSRGKVLFTMTNGSTIRELYLDGRPNIEGRPIFTSSSPGNPDAAFVRFDNPTSAELNAAAQAGYLIRTRTDSPTDDARENNIARRDTAFASGAHYLSTDYYQPSEFFDSPYVVRFDDGAVARCNPITAPPSCNNAELSE